ncbi:MAG: phosphoglycerol transferase MdoB-like AlkP superfamily enzyme [Bacteroidia bacterium]|jgi:phosphoglycerol transferase MdoB-like AlkP superfamily enzyme
MKTLPIVSKVFISYTLFFVISRVVFFGFNFQEQSEAGFGTLLDASYHGLPMDLSMAGYATLFSALLLLLGNMIKWPYLKKVIVYVNVFLITLFSVFLVINSRLYGYWGYHIDNSILNYLKTPKEAMASANLQDWVVVLVASIALIFVSYKVFKWFVFKPIRSYLFKRTNALIVLPLLAVLIVPIRGGFDVATMNVSRVYFSTKPFENHLAINPVWNAAFSLTEADVDQFDFMSNDVCDAAYRSAFPIKSDLPSFQFDPETNVILVVLESFTANVVSSIGGLEGVTPNLNAWMEKGMSYDHFYSSGDRSDKGLTTLFTGFPALPNSRLLSHPTKLSNAPSVYKGFHDRGYYTSFYYGGNLDFANLKLLFSDGNLDQIVTRDDIDSKSNGKWGVRDGEMFNNFYQDVSTQKQPFFSTLYTLSSHEPFDIPTVSFSSDSLTSDFYKALYYTDSCFGAFMSDLKKSDIWENTVVVVTADHGVKNPGNLVLLSPRKYRIPLLLTGGAVKTKRRYSHYCSHTDIPYSLEISFLGGTDEAYKFSKSIFDTTASQAYYYYVLGAGLINENGCVVYDIKGDLFLVNTTQNDSIYQQMQRQLLGVTQKASELFNSY